jgi:hypothetical protein
MAIGVSFSQGDMGVGLPLTTAIALQDIPEGLAVAMALRAAGLVPLRAALVAGATGLMEPLGALLGIGLSSGLVLAYPIGLGLAASHEGAQDAAADFGLHGFGGVAFQILHLEESRPAVRIGLEHTVDDTDEEMNVQVERESLKLALEQPAGSNLLKEADLLGHLENGGHQTAAGRDSGGIERRRLGNGRSDPNGLSAL